VLDLVMWSCRLPTIQVPKHPWDSIFHLAGLVALFLLFSWRVNSMFPCPATGSGAGRYLLDALTIVDMDLFLCRG